MEPKFVGKPRWHVFTMDKHSGSGFTFLRDAIAHVQNNNDTDQRPKRLRAGLYQLRRDYIGTAEAAKAEGFTFSELDREFKVELFRVTLQ